MSHVTLSQVSVEMAASLAGKDYSVHKVRHIHCLYLIRIGFSVHRIVNNHMATSANTKRQVIFYIFLAVSSYKQYKLSGNRIITDFI